MSSLFVGNLSSHVRHRELENVFRRFGRSNLELKDGFGFVVYEEHRDAKRALEALQGRSVCGEQPSISWARKRRPFQRYTGKTNFGTREKYQSRRRSSLETDRGSDDGRRDEKFLDEVKDGSRSIETKEGAARSTEREAEWKDSGPEKPGFDEEIRDIDPLDSGRWDPHMDGSPENMMVDGLLEDEEHAIHDKDKANEKGIAHEKSQGSPVDRHFKRSSRGYRNSSDQHRRGRDAFSGRPQERCYNCGQSGHVKWQCRSRLKRISMHSRDGGYDSRRNDSRYFSGRGGFRGIGGGRFRGMNGSRRMLTRGIEAGYAKRSSRRHDVTGDRRHYDPVDNKTRDKDRRRRHRSESPKDSSSRGRSKRKHKKSSKKSTHSTKKRHRSSSGSPSSSQSPRSSSSSPSGSRSRSAASRSQSSKSGSQSSSSGSHSRSSQSQSSRSRSSSASSLSRSRSVSSQSRKSPTKSGSGSPSSHSRGSCGISSASPKAKRSYSPHSNSQGGSRSSTYEEDKEVATYKCEMQEKQAHDNGTEERDDWKYSPEGHDIDQTDAKRRERRRMWSREAKRQKNQTRSDTEEPHSEAELQSNGVRYALKSIEADESQLSVPQDGTANEPVFKDSVSLKASELPSHSQMADAKCSLYVAIMKEGSKGTGGHDGGQELATADFGAARLWPWEAMLYRRIKRGPISTANYERRKAQNEEFEIKDTFVRSSSGWWEKQGE